MVTLIVVLIVGVLVALAIRAARGSEPGEWEWRRSSRRVAAEKAWLEAGNPPRDPLDGLDPFAKVEIEGIRMDHRWVEVDGGWEQI